MHPICPICEKHPTGQHIYYRCRNHPDRLYTTKNIDFLGARHIFPAGPLEKDCDCSIDDLYHDCEYTLLQEKRAALQEMTDTLHSILPMPMSRTEDRMNEWLFEARERGLITLDEQKDLRAHLHVTA